MATVTVEVEKALIQGRNGNVNLSEVEIFQSFGGLVYIQGISRTKKICVNGGFFDITPEEMDALAEGWLEYRRKNDEQND